MNRASSEITMHIKILLLFVSSTVLGEWVEIPQFSNKKSYIVTPHDPYIYEKSSFFSSTTQSSYETIVESTFREVKKSITKLPDSFLKLTTEVSASSKTTLKPPVTKSNKNSNKPKKNNGNKNRRNDKVSNTTKVNQVFVNEKKYDEEIEYEEDEYVEEEEYYDDDEYYDDTEYVEEEDDDETDGTIKGGAGTQKGDSSGYSYAAFIPYLQKIQSTLMRTSHKKVKNKVSFLTEIKDRLLYAIKQKIASIWAPAKRTRTKRSNRGDLKYDDHDLQFPSNEGALLTIGFLTFAVFLIKCILKLIYAIKGKNKGHHYPKGMVVMSMPGMDRRRRRNGRSLADQIDILKSIDEFKI